MWFLIKKKLKGITMGSDSRSTPQFMKLSEVPDWPTTHLVRHTKLVEPETYLWAYYTKGICKGSVIVRQGCMREGYYGDFVNPPTLVEQGPLLHLCPLFGSIGDPDLEVQI
jgi:hypothetical protein